MDRRNFVSTDFFKAKNTIDIWKLFPQEKNTEKEINQLLNLVWIDLIY